MSNNRTIEILQHKIRYWYSEDQEMPESEQDHVKQMIIDGYNQGELNHCSESENRGWWRIV